MTRRAFQLGVVFLGLLFGAVVKSSGKKSYTGDKLIQVVPKTLNQLDLLQQMQRNGNVDFWISPSLNRACDIHISSAKFRSIIERITSLGMQYTVLIDNLQREIDEEQAQMIPTNDGAIVGTYARHDEINDWLTKMATQYSDIAVVETIGKTYEGRDMKVIKIGLQVKDETKPVIWIEGGIHAREWIVPATAVYIINKLLTECGVNENVTQLMTEYDLHILPSANPDGYEYSHTTDRLWRKNRRPVGYNRKTSRCVGVDGNRNFDIAWGGVGVSFDPCSDIYLGPSPFSENETSSIRDAVLADASRIKIYLSWHSYSQLILIPWSYTTEKPEDYDELFSVALEALLALEAVNGTDYNLGTSPDILYGTAGASDDWAKAVAGVKYAYTFEFRPIQKIKRSGFILPPEQIEPNSEEVFAALFTMATEVKGKQ